MPSEAIIIHEQKPERISRQGAKFAKEKQKNLILKSDISLFPLFPFAFFIEPAWKEASRVLIEASVRHTLGGLICELNRPKKG